MSNPGLIALDVAAFRAQFSKFANTLCFPDIVIQGWWDTATNFVTDWRYPGIGTPSQRVLAVNLVTAHIGFLYNAIANGEPTGVLTSAQIDKIRVDTKPPPGAETSNFQWWLSQTPFGQQLLALFATMTVGGIYVGGLPERDAIRRVGGGFGGVTPGGRGWLR